ncbi:metal-dependent hydrolase [Actinomadura fibrosa]|uniref:Metal-dependent hydrolase n=1 Tax=Actinomadura fibrosa TaxID=111802 RepID=A0ABW2XEG6_9ACTN|nr:metal-dependent hydrolase [Actinomadura fibrosa]
MNQSDSMKVRRIHFPHGEGSLRRHFVDGDLVMSHLVAVLSATFPPGEDFFIRSVRHYHGQITDPELKAQVKTFIGQEVVHGREHDSLNQTLRRLGYPTHRVHRSVERGLRFNTRFLPARANLAATAALEHYTATLAENLLTDERSRVLLGDSTVRDILLWHALEESEHKAVAFDVFRSIGGTDRMRIRAMRRVTVLFLLHVSLWTLLSLLTDRAAYNPRRLIRSLAALRHAPFLDRDVISQIRAYNKPGFHPSDIDSTATLTHWRNELFGPHGTLTPHLR